LLSAINPNGISRSPINAYSLFGRSMGTATKQNKAWPRLWFAPPTDGGIALPCPFSASDHATSIPNFLPLLPTLNHPSPRKRIGKTHDNLGIQFNPPILGCRLLQFDRRLRWGQAAGPLYGVLAYLITPTPTPRDSVYPDLRSARHANPTFWPLMLSD